MSVKAMAWAFDQAIPPGPKIVLLAVADRTWDEAGHWFIHWLDLEVRCSLARRTIRRYLSQLQENGLLTLASRYDQRSGVQLTNYCVLHRGRAIATPSDWGEGTNHGHLDVVVEGACDGHPGDLLRPGEGTCDGHPLILNSSPSSSENVSETSKSHVSAHAPKYGFAVFWVRYPRKKSKGQAERAWAKLKPSEPLQNRLFEALERAKTSVEWRRDGGQFIPYPATWLNAKGWEDESTISTGRPIARSMVELLP